MPMLKLTPMLICACAAGSAKRGTATAAAMSRRRRWWLNWMVDLLAATLPDGRVELSRKFGVAG